MTQETVPAKQAAAESPAERTHTRPTFSPRVDIYEREDAIVLLADMPGVSESTLDVRLEEGVLTIKGRVEPPSREGLALVYSEYTVGDYERAFQLSDVMDVEHATASVKNGVLCIELPKVPEAKPRKIEVKAG